MFALENKTMLITGVQSAQGFEVLKWPKCNKTLLCPAIAYS